MRLKSQLRRGYSRGLEETRPKPGEQWKWEKESPASDVITRDLPPQERNPFDVNPMDTWMYNRYKKDPTVLPPEHPAESREDTQILYNIFDNVSSTDERLGYILKALILRGGTRSGEAPKIISLLEELGSVSGAPVTREDIVNLTSILNNLKQQSPPTQQSFIGPIVNQLQNIRNRMKPPTPPQTPESPEMQIPEEKAASCWRYTYKAA